MQILGFKKVIVLTIILLLYVVVIGSPVYAQAGAASAISSARNTILSCYSAAREAETAGANITALTVTLNTAASLLSQAEFSYSMADFDAAFDFASQSQSTLANFVGEATVLKETAAQQQNQDFLVNVVGSIIGTLVVLVSGFAVWLFLKKKYETAEGYVNESPNL